jgi:heat shock protein HslJ
MWRRRRGRTALMIGTLILVILLAWARISAWDGTGDDAAGALTASEWTLVSLNDDELSAGTTVTIAFDGRRLGGSGGCNHYGGDYTASGESLRVADVESTLMACEKPVGVMDQEREYYRILGHVSTFQVVDGRLELRTDHGERLVFARQE